MSHAVRTVEIRETEMPKFAVMMRYEVVSALIVDAASEDEAEQIASDFEEAVHDRADDSGPVTLEARIWGNGDVDIEQAADEDDAQERIDSWIETIDWDEDDDFDDEYDDFDDEDEDDVDEDEDDEDDFDDEEEIDARR